MKPSQAGWEVHRHGGAASGCWRVAFTGNEKPARNQFYLVSTGMQRGGVRLIDARGIIVASVWCVRGEEKAVVARRVECEIGRRPRADGR